MFQHGQEIPEGEHGHYPGIRFDLDVLPGTCVLRNRIYYIIANDNHMPTDNGHCAEYRAD